MATTISASEYLSKSETKLRSFKREWESFTTEAPQKFLSLVKSGIKPTVSRGPSVPGQISVSLNFESNMDAAKAYVEKMRDKIEDKNDEISNQIKDMDKKLQLYLDEGVDGDTFSKLVKNMNEWIAYIPKMSFKIGNNDINIKADDSIIKIKKKWEKVSAEEVRKKEAEKYGVALSDLDNHKKYLEAKSKKANGKTSAVIKEAKKELAALKGYLDSAELAQDCDAKIEKLVAKEAEEKRIAAEKKAEEERIRKEKEEERKRKEAEEKRIAEEKKKQEIEENKVIVQKCLDQIEEYKTQVKLAVNEKKNRTTARIMQRIEQLKSEKQRHEATLKSLGLFSFSDKKREKEEIARIETEIEMLSKPDYLSEKLKKIQQNGDASVKKYKADVEDFLAKKYNLDYKQKKAKEDIIDIKAVNAKEMKNNRYATASQKENNLMQLEILKIIYDAKKKMTISDIVEQLEKSKDYVSNQRVSALVRQLKEGYYLERSENKGYAYFAITDSAIKRLKSAKPTEPKKTAEPYVENKFYSKHKCPEMPIIEEVI